MTRLFVPLTAEAFGWWASGRKRFEVRRWAPRWSPQHVYEGRRVELRRGYSGPSLWGTIGRVLFLPLRELPLRVYPAAVVPSGRLTDIERAIGAQTVDDPVVAFEVILDEVGE